MASPIVDQEFVVHLFLFEEGPRADQAYAEVLRMWRACREQLGMTAPIAGLPFFDVLPPRREDLPEGEVIAAQERSGTQDRQCVLRRVGEVLNLSVMMLQPRPERSGLWRIRGNSTQPKLGWREFSQLWSRVSGNAGEMLLGEAILLLARTQTKRRRQAGATSQLAESLAHLLPHDETRRRGWWRNGTASPLGFAVWDMREGQMIGTRELLIVAPPNADHELSTWVWSDHGSAHLPPFAEYLLHAALLRYQAEVFENWQAAPQPPDMSDLVRDMTASFDQLGADGAQDDDLTVLVQSHLRRLQRSELDLNTLMERMRRIVDTSSDSLEQMAKVWGPDQPRASMLATDVDVVTSLIRQASREHDNLSSRLARTTNARQLVADELARSAYSARGRPLGLVERSAASAPGDVSRNIFVVHGRDTEAKRAIFTILQALGLRPLDWEVLVNATGTSSPTLMDVIRTAPQIAQATVVLMTPDDTVQLHADLAEAQDPKQETDLGCQPRPNVLIELGMVLMEAPDNTIIIESGSLRPISDVGGINVIRFDGSPQSIIKIARRLKTAGCPVDDSDTDLYNPDRFTGLRAFTRQPHDPIY